MLRYRRAARGADVVHFQWLPVQALDALLLPRRRPRVLTAHDVLPREPKPAQLAGQRKLYERMDAVVVHSEHGAARLRDELGPRPGAGPRHPARRARQPRGARAAPRRCSPRRSPVVLFFGLIRPYKGLDVLLEAWRAARARTPSCGSSGCRGWTSSVRSTAPGVRTALRFVSGAELAGAFAARRPRRAALPRDRPVGRAVHRARVRQAAAAQRVGGFPEIATGAASSCRRATLTRSRRRSARCSPTPRRAARDGGAPRAPRAGRPYGWDAIAAPHARALRGAPGVDRCGRRAGRASARRGALLAGVEEPGPLGHALATACCPRGSAARSGRARARRRAQSRSSVTAREATPRPRAAAATQ